jgi:hypothetical protein
VTGWDGTEPAGTVFSSHQLHTEDAMSLPKLLATAAILSVIGAPAMAQQVISEPGYCAFFYPNANCQNKGPNNPYTGDYQRRLEMRDTLVLGAGPCAAGAEFFIGRGGRRIYCY